jgi:hypothetical protein
VEVVNGVVHKPGSMSQDDDVGSEALELSLTRTRGSWMHDPTLIHNLRRELDAAGPEITEIEMATLAVEVEEQYNYGKPAEWRR